ncbi:MAG: lysophospholipase [Candidatus Omnitrophica bacterium]|nr:lysophospholipase [Candidatus Omnitrophota bacterium]
MHTEGYLTTSQAPRLYWQGWRCGPQQAAPSAAQPLLIIHGIGEHSGRYEQTARQFVQAGYVVYAYDLRGHGKSPGVRGHIDQFEDYVSDAAAFVRFVSEHHAMMPPILLGHSLGGLIAAHYAAQHAQAIRALILSSPFWGFGMRVPQWKHGLAYALSSVWPSLTMKRPRHHGIALSHDPQVIAAWERDPLVHRVASARCYVEIRRAAQALPSVLPRLRVPTLALQAGEDLIGSADAVTQFFPLIGSAQKQLIIYDGFYHEVLNEVDRARVIQDLLAWLRPQPR